VGSSRAFRVTRPSIDLLVGCGGWSLPLLLLSWQLVDVDARPGVQLPALHGDDPPRLRPGGRPRPPSPREVALVIVKFGDALGRSGRYDLARTQYQLADRIAATTGLSDISELVRVRLPPTE
jgi:hypothetical protein